MNKSNRRWQAFAGYALDLYRLSKARLINPHSYLKFIHLNTIRQQSGAPILIETGTYRGVSAYRCSFVFTSVFTIEIDPTLAAAATAFLAKRRNVQVICGDAVSVLPRVFESNEFQAAVVFLDGHYSGADTGSSQVPEPALHEMKVLECFKERLAGVVIDDFRCFGEEDQFPKKSELLKASEDWFPEFRISVQFDQLALVRRS